MKFSCIIQIEEKIPAIILFCMSKLVMEKGIRKRFKNNVLDRFRKIQEFLKK
jgi:hypothetical protein